jgi:hypothetical protein
MRIFLLVTVFKPIKLYVDDYRCKKNAPADQAKPARAGDRMQDLALETLNLIFLFSQNGWQLKLWKIY